MILAIARPVMRKNLTTLARTYANSPTLQSCANLVIIAGQHGPDARENAETAAVWNTLRSILDTTALKGLVALPPSHKAEAIGSLYALARKNRGVFVNVAFHEPFGLTLLEAASHGLPVVAGDRGGPPDIVAQTGHGRVIDPTDPTALEATLKDLLSDSAAWDQHASAAQKNLSPFHWTAWAKNVAQICDGIVHPSYHAKPRPAYVLGCDIDNTLTGSAIAAAAFGHWHDTRRGLFAVATGRSIVEARRVLYRPPVRAHWLFCPSSGARSRRTLRRRCECPADGTSGHYILRPHRYFSASACWCRDYPNPFIVRGDRDRGSLRRLHGPTRYAALCPAGMAGHPQGAGHHGPMVHDGGSCVDRMRRLGRGRAIGPHLFCAAFESATTRGAQRPRPPGCL